MLVSLHLSVLLRLFMSLLLLLSLHLFVLFHLFVCTVAVAVNLSAVDISGSAVGTAAVTLVAAVHIVFLLMLHCQNRAAFSIAAAVDPVTAAVNVLLLLSTLLWPSFAATVGAGAAVHVAAVVASFSVLRLLDLLLLSLSPSLLIVFCCFCCSGDYCYRGVSFLLLLNIVMFPGIVKV